MTSESYRPTAATKVLVLKRLISSRKLIENPNNWTQGRSRYCDLDGNLKYCAIGAMHYSDGIVLYDDTNFVTTKSYLRDTIGKIYPNSLPNIAIWNDSPDRKHSEVLELFDVTIAQLRSEIEAENATSIHSDSVIT